MAQAEVAKSELGVRMAQMQLDKQQRDEDYNLRLASHGLAKEQMQLDKQQRGEDYILRLASYGLAKEQNGRQAAAEARVAQDHARQNAERVKMEVESNFSSFQNEDGSYDYSSPNAAKAISNINFMLKEDPYAGEVVRSWLGIRTGDKDLLQMELLPDGKGLAGVVSNRADPSIQGVLTDGASKDPNDPVSVISGDEIRQFIDITKKAEQFGASPAVTAYFLHKSFGIGGNGEMNVSPEIEQQADLLGQELFSNIQDASTPAGTPAGMPAEDIRPIQNQPAPASLTDKLAQVPQQTQESTTPKYKNIFGQRSGLATAGAFVGNVGTAFGQAGDAIADSAVNVGNKATDTVGGWAKEFMYGLNGGSKSAESTTPTTGDTKAAETPAALDDFAPRDQRHVQAPQDLSTDGIQAAFSQLEKGSFKVAARESEAVRKALMNKGLNESRRTELMGRYLMMQSLKPENGMTPQSAATLYENGRIRADNYFQMALQQPSEAMLMAEWAAKGGVKAGRSKPEKDEFNESIENTNKALSSLGSKYKLANGDPVPEDVLGGILDFMAANGKIHPQDQYEELQANWHTYAAAIGSVAKNWDLMEKDGRTNKRSLIAAEVHRQKRVKGMEAPPIITDTKDRFVYDKNIYNLFEAFKDDPAQLIRVSAAASLYEDDVKASGKTNLDIGKYVKYAEGLKWRQNQK